MALSTKLQMRQSQSLVMTPQLMQSIKLLQLTHAELEKFVDEEIERNPLIERVDPQDDAATDLHQRSVELAEQSDTWADTSTWSSETIAQTLDASLENVFPDDPGSRERIGPDLAAQWKSAGSGGMRDAEAFDLEDLMVSRPTLRDYVLEQIAFSFRDQTDRAIARDLADCLDEIGYFRGEFDAIAARLGVGTKAVAAVFADCLTFDPPGLFARSLAECLEVQLDRKNRLDPAMREMVSNLDLLARRDFAALKRLCGVGDADLVDMVAEIRALDPRPGFGFAGGSVEAIVSDVEVKAAADGSWTVELNQDALPRVLVDQIYFAQVTQHARGVQERNFLTECMNNANWLTRSLDQRARTILKVATEIVRQQDAFLVHGVRHLRPLNLRTVADAIGMHESTVSRVTSNKYMLTPRGVFELRYFFTASIASASGGEAHSSAAVRDRIRTLVAAEVGDVVHSDDDIVDILRKDGIEIARRTVAKYRESMNIPSSVRRRREKRVLLDIG